MEEKRKQFLDQIGLEFLLNKLKEKLATKTAVQEAKDAAQTVKDDTDMYVTEVDYSQIQFDTTESYEKVLEANTTEEGV